MKIDSYIPHKRHLLFTAISLSLLPISGTSLAQDDVAEEVIVTGSFIRRSEGFTSASQMTQFTAEDIDAEGTINMGEIIQNLSFVGGSESAITDSIQGTSSNSTSINLRGLGGNATLTLLDGKRTPTENINVLMPTIAIERLDIVADGAAALYGSEAVAGVVNFVSVKQYDGLKLELYSEGDDRGDFSDSQFSFLYGKELAPGFDIVIAGSQRDARELKWIERPDLMNAGLVFSSTANPGNFRVPIRDENGVLTGEAERQPDPSCGVERQDPSVEGANPNGFLLGGRCRFDFGDQRAFREPNQITTFYTRLNYEYSSDLSLSAQFNFSRQLENGFSSTSNPGGRDSQLPTIRGELPGNPFPAVDSNGNAVFARDANGDTLPDRDANGVVILDPNGIPFNEDVNFNGWRPLGKAQTVPSAIGTNFSNPDEGDDRFYHVVLQADFTVPFLDGWEGTAFYTYNLRQDQDRASQLFSFSALEQGLNCDVLLDRDACFNPFAPISPEFLNTQAVADSILTQDKEDNEVEANNFDLILNGNLLLGGFELPGGPIGMAIGYQRREDSFDNVPPASVINNDQFIGDQVLPFGASREVNAWFAEFSFPLLSNLSFEAAVRNEDFSSGQESTDPKFGLVWTPANWLTLRGTSGESFIAPTLTQLGAPQRCGLTNADDLFSTFSGFVASCSAGNPNLVSETADNLSFGVDFTPIDDLRISLTWGETDFTDRIVSTTTQDILRVDFFNFQQATGFTGIAGVDIPPEDMVKAWIANPLSDKRVIRNPNDVTNIERVLQSDSNASSILVQAYDLDIDYRFEIGNLGTFGVNLLATYMDTYEFQLSPDRPKQEAVGRQNNDFGAVPAVPELKANLRFAWSRGNHNANLAIHYIDNMKFDANDFSFQADAGFSNFRKVTKIKAWTDADLFYSYRNLALFGGNSSITIGARNIFDREAQKTGMTAGIIGELQDPLGRVLYARVNYEF